ncbi:MAG: fibronectin type protein, partial [Dactylosporangium sp.]|nr:fibronectin type protein [Dactylosporangium sp.]
MVVGTSVGLTAGPASAAATAVPSGSPTTFTAVQTVLSSRAVTVHWSSAGMTWDSGATFQTWDVAVTGGTITTDGCTATNLADVADNTCSFTPAADGAFMVSVTPKNDFGSGTAATRSVTVVQPPSGSPTTFTAVQTVLSSRAVTVHWS